MRNLKFRLLAFNIAVFVALVSGFPVLALVLSAIAVATLVLRNASRRKVINSGMALGSFSFVIGLLLFINARIHDAELKESIRRGKMSHAAEKQKILQEWAYRDTHIKFSKLKAATTKREEGMNTITVSGTIYNSGTRAINVPVRVVVGRPPEFGSDLRNEWIRVGAKETEPFRLELIDEKNIKQIGFKVDMHDDREFYWGE